MDDFLKFFAKKVLTYPMHLEVSYSKVTDWGVRVWRMGTAYDGDDEELVNVQHCDAELCFAIAQMQLKNCCWNTKGDTEPWRTSRATP